MRSFAYSHGGPGFESCRMYRNMSIGIMTGLYFNSTIIINIKSFIFVVLKGYLIKNTYLKT